MDNDHGRKEGKGGRKRGKEGKDLGYGPNGVIIRGLGHFEFEVLVGHLGGDGDMGLELTKDV